MGDSIIAQLRKIDKLPTLPAIAQEILNLANDPLFSIEKLTDVVARDPVIIAKILSLANSAFFGISDRTTNLNVAIMRIGFNNVKNIAIGISILTLLNDGKRSASYSQLYNHALSVGLIARSIAKKLRIGISEDILIEGLLHDLGFLVLNKLFPDMFKQVVQKVDGEICILDAEKDMLNHTHAEIGFWLAEHWDLPATVRDIILYHHTPSLATRNPKHLAAVHIADYIAAKNFYRPISNDPLYPLDQGSFEILTISNSDLLDIEHSVSDTFGMLQNSKSTGFNAEYNAALD